MLTYSLSAGGAVIAILGFGLILKFYYSTVMISVGTVILICGVAIWMAATPEDYNRADGVVKMITFGDTIRKIEDFYEAFKNVPTPLGSGYLGRFYTMKQPGLIFGPDEYGNYLYFWSRTPASTVTLATPIYQGLSKAGSRNH